jgi:hypothetical protein
MIFVTQGDKPITDSQLQKRTQAYIERDWPQWKRERAMRTDATDLNAYMDQVAADTDTNRANNTFNQQLADYRVATARLAQYVVADGRAEVREMQPTGEQTFNEETGEMEDVMMEVVTVTAIEPVEATVTRMVYSDDMDAEPTEETIENPLITVDNEERAAAQAVVDATPQAVKDAA